MISGDLIFLIIGYVAGLWSGHYFFVKKGYTINIGKGDKDGK